MNFSRRAFTKSAAYGIATAGLGCETFGSGGGNGLTD
jgi:hypothetical protein